MSEVESPLTDESISGVQRTLQVALTNKPVAGNPESENTKQLLGIMKSQITQEQITKEQINQLVDAKLASFISQINASQEFKTEKETQITTYKTGLKEFCITGTETNFKGSFVNTGFTRQGLENNLSSLLQGRSKNMVMTDPRLTDVALFSEESQASSDDALARRKKPNVELNEDDLQNMFRDWLAANGINPDEIQRTAAKKQTLICDAERDMDVISVQGIPTINGQKSLELFVPRETNPKIGNLNKPEDPGSNEQFAQNYIEMLGLKAEMDIAEKGIEIHNRLSSILFRCLLSLVLGYLYNNGLDMLRNAIFTGSVESELAKDIAFQFVQQQVDEGILQEGDYTKIGEQYDAIYSLLVKDSVLNPDIKNRIFPDPSDAPMEQQFETLLEMIVRIANETPKTDETYFTILHGACFSITLILNKYQLITTAAGELVEPYLESILHLAADDSTILQRLQSIIFLAVAYNSYGWLFTVMAPLALPSVLSFGKWALCSVAQLPFGIIKFTGKGLLSVGKFFIGYQEDKNIMPIDANSENTLIQVGWIKKQIGDDIKFIPHMVSKGDVQRLSHYIANHEIQKPSLLSSIFDGHGVFDHSFQSTHSPDEWSFYLRKSNPVGRFICCITEEFAELTTDDRESPDYVPTLEESMFTLLFKTIRDESVDGGFTLQPLVDIWTETLFTKFYAAEQATYASFEGSSFKDTVLESIVMMLSSGYVDYMIKQGESVPGSPTLTPTSSADSTMSTMSTTSQITISGTDIKVSLNTDLDFENDDAKPINLSLDIIKLTLDEPPSLSRESSVSSVSFYSFGSENSITREGCHLNLEFKEEDEPTVKSIFNPDLDPKILLKTMHTDIAARAESLKTKMMIEDIKEIQQLQKANSDILDSLIKQSQTPHLSGFIIADAVGHIMDALLNLSLAISQVNKGGRKIKNNAIYRAIKSKLMPSVYGKSKRRQRKRYTKKRGFKKGHKQMTKKIYRKRRSTHKKYKRH